MFVVFITVFQSSIYNAPGTVGAHQILLDAKSSFWEVFLIH